MRYTSNSKTYLLLILVKSNFIHVFIITVNYLGVYLMQGVKYQSKSLNKYRKVNFN